MKKNRLIIDLGTTNILLRLVAAGNFREINTVSIENPQKIHGLDVISRLTFFSIDPEKNLKILQELAGQGISEGFKLFGNRYAPAAVRDIMVVGNTVMLHFFWGRPPVSLLGAPFNSEYFRGFTEKTAAAAGLGQFKKATIFSPPVIKSFVGADFLADLFFLSGKSKPFALLDLGTNAEAALVTDEEIFLTSAAAGPAFSGYDTERIIYGSELIRSAAGLLRSQAMDCSGLILHKSQFYLQKNMRNLQTAKAAVKTALGILLKKAALPAASLKAVYITGFFGSRVTPADIKKIDLLPTVIPASKIVYLPNLPLGGAGDMLRQLATGRSGLARLKKEISQNIFSGLKYLNLAAMPDFNDLFIKNIEFCKKPEGNF